MQRRSIPGKAAVGLRLICTIALVVPGAASAAPATVDLRVEGVTQTLFEGPVRADGHDVRASSDKQVRHCDGTNNRQHPTPGPTATSVSVDAMGSIGQTFDGKWYPGFDDYFITRFGPDGQADSSYAYWGILVDGVFTSVGGCQFQVADGQHVLWTYDAFNNRPFLQLRAASDAGAQPQPVATATLGVPLTVKVTSSTGGMDGAAQNPGPFSGAHVSPVITAANGHQQTRPQDPAAVTTGADGTAQITFSTPGWHRVKADDGTVTQRSNRLDVCVPAAGASDCGALPADAQVRDVPPASTAPVDPGTGTPAPPATTDPTMPPPPAPPAPMPTPSFRGPDVTAASALRLSTPTITTGGARRGRVSVRWSVLAGDATSARWTIASRTIGGSAASTPRATGTTQTAAQLVLPPGHGYALRLTTVDGAGRTQTAAIGDVVAPTDDRARTLRYSGRWSRPTDASAWRGTLSRASRGASVRVRLGRGRPTAVLGPHSAGTIELRAGGTSQRLAVEAVRGSGTRVVLGRARGAGAVTIRVVSGTIDLDGVAVQ